MTGKTWGLSKGGPGTSQSLIGFGAGSCGAAYQQGAAVATDGGKTFTKHAIPGLNTTLYPARYAAFPSATTWYVSHGTWETTGATATPGVSVHLSDTISFAQGRGLKHTPVSDYSVAGNASDGYAGAISKTTDGGKPVKILQRTFVD